MPGSILGNAVRRVEDPDLLTGRGTFVDNLKIDGMLSLAFVRSPIAHGRIRVRRCRRCRANVPASSPSTAPRTSASRRTTRSSP